MKTKCHAIDVLLDSAATEKAELNTAVGPLLTFLGNCAADHGLVSYDCDETEIIPTLKSIFEDGRTSLLCKNRAFNLLLGMSEKVELKGDIVTYVKELGQKEIFAQRDAIEGNFESDDADADVRYLFRAIKAEERNVARREAFLSIGADEPSDEEAGSDSDVDPDEAIVDENADDDDE